MKTNKLSKRFFAYGIVLLVILLLLTSFISLAFSDDHMATLTPNATLNWLGILITVFSLAVTFFLAVMAIEAFSHMNHLREATQKYGEFIERLEEDEQKFETAQTALNQYNAEMLSLVDFYVQKSHLSFSEKLRFSKKFQTARARLELSNLNTLQELTYDTALSHILVLSEHGGIADLKFALETLKSLNDPLGTIDLASNIVEDLKKKEREAPLRKGGEQFFDSGVI